MKRKSVISLILRVGAKPLERGSNGQNTDKAVRVLLFGGCATDGSWAGSGGFASDWVRSDSNALVGFFTTVKLD